MDSLTLISKSDLIEQYREQYRKLKAHMEETAEILRGLGADPENDAAVEDEGYSLVVPRKPAVRKRTRLKRPRAVTLDEAPPEGQAERVREIIKSFEGGEFNVEKVIDAVTSAHDLPVNRKAVRSQLLYMSKNGVIEVVKPGAPGGPSTIYKAKSSE